ncbi:MAG: mechanosensitive ion channel [Myxococcales bacterium]|nr:mechanosensitive ion channel [Myxococcales bacterium]
MNTIEEMGRAAERFHLVLLLPILVAWAFGPPLRRWLRSVGARRGADLGDALDRTAWGSIRLVLLLVGLHWAVAMLPVDPRFTSGLGGAIYVLAVVVLARLAIRIAGVLLDAYLEAAAVGPARERARKDYLPLASTLSTVAIALAAVILIAHHFGHDVSSLVTALGIGSLAIGLAAQQTIGNMIAGFTLLVDRPFRPGDRIRLQSAETGEVSEIGIRSTRILLDDQNLLIVPNAELVNSRVVNLALPSPVGRGEVKFKLAWDRVAGIEGLLALAEELARGEPEVAADPAPWAAVASLNEPGVEVVLYFQVIEQAAQRRVEARIRQQLARRLAAR